ncbi:hypothetical protein [Rhodococcoides yunnanense]|uniref:hypothetical protein n=1 Tax=Rhodococcoides yunnanense TaxID=278209 RepID=UPI0009329D0E|nr:hypothetical protein [Rhodococcus yunnanensis]
MTTAPDLAQTTELGCRSLFRVNSDAHLSDRVHEQLYAWCKEKNWDADKIVGPGIVEIADGVTASLVREERQDGSTIERWRFHQDEGQAIWVTQVTTLVDRNSSGWVWTDVSGPDTQTPGVPRLVRNILQVTEGLDGAYRLTAEPYRATVDDVDDIYNAIMDPDRRGFLFLAGADDNVNIPHADWLGFISKLLAGTRGIASAYVLDATATLALNARLPASHRVREWAVRTFLPDPRLDDPRDGVRHRILTTARIVEDSRSRLRGLLARSACRHSAGMPLPHELVRIDRKLRQLLDDTIVDRVEVSAPVEELAPAPTKPQTPAALSDVEPPTSRGVFAALRSVVSTVIGSAEVTVDAVARLGALASEALSSNRSLDLIRTRLRSLENERSNLEDQNVEFLRRAQDGQDELAAARIDLDDAEKQLRHLRSELAKLDRAGTVAWVPETNPADEPPTTFAELIERISEFEHVRFTGESKYALELDEHGLLEWSIRTWSALRGLNDYCRLRSSGQFDDSVDDYINAVPAGCAVITPGSHASGETKSTQSHPLFGPPRILPVPKVVDPAGKVFMGAHVRIAKYGSVSPRMHYFNHATGTGKIYVGYIGEHLPNFRTT